MVSILRVVTRRCRLKVIFYQVEINQSEQKEVSYIRHIQNVRVGKVDVKTFRQFFLQSCQKCHPVQN